MAPHRRTRIASRRRIEDDGEEDGSVSGDVEDDSLSEDTASSRAGEDRDVEGSDISEHEPPKPQQTNGHPPQPPAQPDDKPATGNTLFETRVSETEAMLNGMKLTDEGQKLEELDFEDMNHELDAVAAAAAAASSAGQTAHTTNNVNSNRGGQKRDNPAGRGRDQYTKEKETNPAFVPTRGGFFLHDKRSSNSPQNGQRPPNKPKPKPHGLIVNSNAPRRPPPKPDATEGQWTHDLHETVQDMPPAQQNQQPPVPSQPNPPSVPASRPVPTAPRSSPPNRSFSTTVHIGNVPVIVLLPGMKDAVSFSSVPKKQHTRLPQHRPPLRRDKPVRISLPGQASRYIFPAMERSFIFIPRALRPNQQGYRGRGRGGFYGGSKRPSVYAGSTYTASLPISRRSSMGRTASRNGVCSPAGSMVSRPGMHPGDGAKPVVRLPPNVQPPQGPPPRGAPMPVPSQHQPQQPPHSYAPPQHAPFRENRPHPSIPIHQPRPQKAVSVADIESPMVYPPTQEQAFHQQVPPPPGAGPGFVADPSAYPPHTRQVSHPPQASATPLSHIPERAIHAPVFQPVPFQQPPNYHPGASYPPGPMMYPAEYPPYAGGGGFVPPGQYGGPPPQGTPSASGEQQQQPQQQQQQQQQGQPGGTVAHESNGMVYFYDASQMPANGQGPPPNSGYQHHGPPPPGPLPHMGGGMTPPGGTTYYYPPPPNGTVYYS